MQRHRAASRLTSWVFVAALLLKSAVPLLASAAAGLQGRATAEVCDVYGVDTSMLGALTPATRAHSAHEPHQAHDAAHAGHGHAAHDADTARHAHDAPDANQALRVDGAGSLLPSERAPLHGPASRVAHGGDHCALSALAFALTSDAPSVGVRPATVAPIPAGGATTAPVLDPAARWAAQLQHAPPASS